MTVALCCLIGGVPASAQAYTKNIAAEANVVIGGGNALGAVTGAGDVNRDGRDDVLVSASSSGSSVTSHYVVFGQATPTSINLNSLGVNGYRIVGATEAAQGNQYYGAVAANAGDVNGDGRPDQIIGAPYADNNSKVDSGSAYVVFGKATTTNVSLDAPGSQAYRIDGAATDSQAGFAVSGTGDLNGDGRADLIIGAPYEDPGGRTNAGAAYVLYGKSTTTSVNLAALGTAGYRIDGAAASDTLGYKLSSAGDANGDGRPDHLLASPSATNNGRAGAGSAYVVFGKATPANVSAAALGASGYRIDAAAANDMVWSVSPAGDVNGDGRADQLIGSIYADNNGRTDSGSVYVVYGKSTFLSVDLANLTDKGYRIDAPLANIYLGPASNAGDVNGDGRPDQIIGAPGGTGAWVVYSRASHSPVPIDLASLGSGGITYTGGFGFFSGFGSSVTNAGDSNGDGRTDQAVMDNTRVYVGWNDTESDPPTSSISHTAESGSDRQFFSATDRKLFYNPIGGGGSFKLSNSPTDSGSGVAKVDWGAVAGAGFSGAAAQATSAPWASGVYTFDSSNTTAPGPLSVRVADRQDNTTADDVSLVRDTTAPSASLTTPAANARVSTGQTLAATASDSGAGVRSVAWRYCAGTTCSYAGSTAIGSPDTSAPYAVSWSAPPAEGTYTLLARTTDNVGNTTDLTRTVTVDKTGPTGAVSHTALSRPDLQRWEASSATLFYNPIAAGTFELGASPSDPAGVGSVGFPAISATGFSGAASNAPSAPYRSGVYSFATTNATAPGTASVTMTDTLGNASMRSVNFARDTTGPSVTPSIAARVRNGASLSASATDAGAGVKQVEFRYCAGSSCTFGAGTPIGAPVTAAPYTTSWSSQPADGTYTVVARATDEVGNTTDASRTVAVDNTAPATGTLGVEPGARPDLQYYDTAAERLFYNPAASGDFRVTATGSDPSGIASVSFPALSDTGFTGAAATPTSSPYRSSTYGFSTANAAAPAPLAVSVSDGVGNAATRSLKLTRDATAPTASISAPASGATISNGQALTTAASDAGAGVASVAYRFCPGSSCSFGAGTAIGSPDTVAPYTATWSSQPADGTYTVAARTTDRVGNTVDRTQTVTIDNTAPGGTVRAVAGARADLQHWSSDDAKLFYNPIAAGDFSLVADPSDPSDVASVGFPAISRLGFEGAAVTKATAPFESGIYGFTPGNDAAPESQDVAITDGSGNATMRSVEFERDTAGPTAAISSAGRLSSGREVTTVASDAGAGVARVELRYCAATSCTYSESTAIGAAQTTAPYTTTWSSQPADGTYTLLARATDRVGNTTDATRTVEVDNTGPTGGVTASPGARPDLQHFNAASSTLFFNPIAAGDFKLVASPEDPAGIGLASFPAIAGMGLAHDTAAAPFESTTYGFGSGTGSAPADASVTLTDSLGNASTRTVRFSRDVTAPTGGSISYPAGSVSSASVAIATNRGSDSGAGLAPGGELQRDEAPVAGNACQPFTGGWKTASTRDDTTEVGKCYRYRYRVTDRVGNAAIYTSPRVLRRVAPAQTPASTGSAGTGSQAEGNQSAGKAPRKPNRPPRGRPKADESSAGDNGPASAGAPVGLLTRSVRIDRRGNIKLRLRCASGTRCRSRLTIFTYVAKGKRRATTATVAAKDSKRKGKRKLVLARKTVTVPRGAARTVTVKISRRARRRIGRNRARRCRISISAGTRTTTRKLVIKPQRRR